MINIHVLYFFTKLGFLTIIYYFFLFFNRFIMNLKILPKLNLVENPNLPLLKKGESIFPVYLFV